MQLFDWDYALRQHSYDDLEIMLETSKYTIQFHASNFRKRKLFERRKLDGIRTPEYLINEDDVKCNGAWNELKQTELYKQIMN